MPDYNLPSDFDMKLEEISMKIFESTKKHRSNIRTSYRTDFNKASVLLASPKQFHINQNSSPRVQRDQLLHSPRLKTITNIYSDKPKKMKKSVRFADAIGLNLVKIVTFLLYPNESDTSMIEDDYHREYESEDSFEDSDEELDLNTFEFNNVYSMWRSCFEQPNLKANFYEQLNDKKVILESIQANKNVLEGTVRVKNISYHKKISLRYTFNDWNTHNDLTCEFNRSFNYDHVLTDQFKFSFKITESLFAKLLEENKYSSSSTCSTLFKVQFAVCYETYNDETQLESIDKYWDNNDLNNYCFECDLKMVA